jgi:hypothetical protein
LKKKRRRRRKDEEVKEFVENERRVLRKSQYPYSLN